MPPKASSPSSHRVRFGAIPFLAPAIASLICGIWGGLVRLPINLPLPSDNANWLTFHGPLMVSGFLGTVIGLERAVGLPDRWPYLAPLLTAAGALTLLAGFLGKPGPVLIASGSAVFVAVTWRVIQLHLALFTVMLSLAGITWLAGNILWACGWPIDQVIPWWIGFLALTILGERLDLSRFQKSERASRPFLFAFIGVFLSGVLTSAFAIEAGERIAGAGLLALGLWLARFDIARRTIRQPGLPRFMALSLLIGFGWLAVAGCFIAAFAPLHSGYAYDAALHSFFLGFVFSMIFGHAPVIFPSVLNLPLRFRPSAYGHLALLHLSVLTRVSGDLLASPSLRQWGALLNGFAVLLFLVNTILSLVPKQRIAGR